MSLTMKKADLDELAAINLLMQSSKAHWGYDEDFMNLYMEKFLVTDAFLQKNNIRSVYQEKELVAFYSFALNDDLTLELAHLFILPQYIGKGLGTELWQACCQTLRELGKNEFILWSDPHSEGFYQKMGCIKIGTRQSPMMPNRFPAIFKYTLRDS